MPGQWCSSSNSEVPSQLPYRCSLRWLVIYLPDPVFSSEHKSSHQARVSSMPVVLQLPPDFFCNEGGIQHICLLPVRVGYPRRLVGSLAGRRITLGHLIVNRIQHWRLSCVSPRIFSTHLFVPLRYDICCSFACRALHCRPVSLCESLSPYDDKLLLQHIG